MNASVAPTRRFTVPIAKDEGLLYPIYNGGTVEQSLQKRTLTMDEFDQVNIFAGLCKTCKDRGDVPNTSWPAIPYCKASGPHFHLAFDCADGSGTVPAPIASRPFFEEVFAHLDINLGIHETAVMHEVLERTCLDKLLPELTETEKTILASEKLFKDLLRFGFASF